MKKSLALFAIAVVVCISSPALAEEDHHHEHAGGPKGGKLLENTVPRAEFFVENDNTATITFYDDALKPIAVTEQGAVVIAEINGNKTELEFEKKGDVLVSKEALPEGKSVNLVVRLKSTADAKPANFRFALEKAICGECKRAEYACICEH